MPALGCFLDGSRECNKMCMAWATNRTNPREKPRCQLIEAVGQFLDAMKGIERDRRAAHFPESAPPPEVS